MKVNILMYGQWALSYCNKSPDLLYRKLLIFFAVRIQLVILASAFLTVSFLYAPRCLRVVWFRSHCLGHGPSVKTWGQGIWGTNISQLSPGQSPRIEVRCPYTQLFVKVGARAHVPCGVGATVIDILMVNPAVVIDIFSLSSR